MLEWGTYGRQPGATRGQLAVPCPIYCCTARRLCLIEITPDLHVDHGRGVGSGLVPGALLGSL